MMLVPLVVLSMGAVFAATDTVLGRRVAIKVLRGRVEDPGARKVLASEDRARDWLVAEAKAERKQLKQARYGEM